MNTNLLKLLELVADNVVPPRVAEQYLQLKNQNSAAPILTINTSSLIPENEAHIIDKMTGKLLGKIVNLQAINSDSTGSNKTTVTEGKFTHEDELIRDEEGDIIGRNVHKSTNNEKVSIFGYVSEDAAKQDLEGWLGLTRKPNIIKADHVVVDKGKTYTTYDSKALELGATKFRATRSFLNGTHVMLLNKIGKFCLITDGDYDVVIHEDGIIKL